MALRPPLFVYSTACSTRTWVRCASSLVKALAHMRMTEMTYGWNLEMQMKAAAMKLRIVELPVAYRCRQGGESKVAGSFQGSIKAASRITRVMLRIALSTYNLK